MMKKIFIILAVAVAAVSLFGCGQKQEEEIIYGDIDFDAEVVEKVKPKSIEKSDSVCGTTYLNLINNGLFCEDEENFYYVIKYEFEKYIVKQNKETNELLKIYKGDIRNLFIVDGWIYCIEKNNAVEHMVVMDSYGNNQIKSFDYKKEIRTMMSDGEKIYFTVDASNITGGMNTYVFSCDMDFSNLNAEKKAQSIASQMDLIAIHDGKKYFYDSYASINEETYIYTNVSVEDKPLLIDGKIYSLENIFEDSSLSNMSSYNQFDNKLYISINNEDKSKMIILDINDGSICEKDYEFNIDSIYEYSDGIIIYANGKFIKENKNV